jgi:hypothetical protein
MRKRAAVTGIAVLGLGLAAALVLRVRPDAESTAPPDDAAAREAEPEASGSAADLVNKDADAARAEPPLAPADAVAVAVARPAAEERAPLPGEAPTTPMTKLLADLQSNASLARTGPPPLPIPSEMIEGERAFSVEPIDAAWAPGAEANLLAKFAQMQGLKLIDLRVECRSTMCRVELSQPPAAPGERPPSFSGLLDSVGLTPRWIMLLVDPSGGPLKSFGYLWRDGFAPPAPGQPHDAN